MIKFETKNSFVEWLKGSTKVVALTISFSTGLANATYSISNSKMLEQINELDSSFLKEGKYYVEYKEIESNDNDIEYSNYAFAITFEVLLLNSKRRSTIGGRSSLIDILSSYDCCARFEKNEFNLGHIWIKLPANSIELDELEQILSSRAALYGFPDGTSTINQNNLKRGNGFRIERKT